MFSHQFKLATSPEEISAYFALRRSIFVEEQGLFQETDVDEIDVTAYPIVAIASEAASSAIQTAFVVGIVRIYEPEPKLWYGGRLGLHRDYRRAGRIGKGLINKAVTTAHAWGCQRFLATVQLQNVRFFQRLHWNSLEELTLCGQPHHLMAANLDYYPPKADLRPVLPISMWEAS